MKDYVKCHKCNFIGLVNIGVNYCPECNKIGCLVWVDINKQEVRDDFYNKTEKSKLEITHVMENV